MIFGYADEDIARALYVLTGKYATAIRHHAGRLVAAEFPDGDFGIWTVAELMDSRTPRWEQHRLPGMPEDPSVPCPVCGGVIFQAIVEYQLGRSGDPPVRWPQRWRHLDDRSLACEEPPAADG